MAAHDPGPHALEDARVVFRPTLEATVKTATPGFYAELDQAFNGFSGCVLVSQHDFSEPWPEWEMHPHGDEMVYLLSGDVDFVLWTGGGERIVRLSTPGHYVVVPKGVWHCARPRSLTRALFITPGEGTRHGVPPGRG